MNFGVLYQKIEEAGFPAGYFYAHVPSLGLTTHGRSIDGARKAAQDLIQFWAAEKTANGEV